MYSQSLQCVLCVESYDLQEHMPRVLVQCGHTLCTKCLKAIVQRPNPSCPLDKTKFKSECHQIDAFPINFAIRDQIEESLGWDICEKHGNRMEVFCLSDESRICLHCAFFEGHKAHEIKHTTEVEFEAVQKKKELEKSLINLSELEKMISNKLEKSKKDLLSVISDRFQELSFLLKAKRQELTAQVETVFQMVKEDRGNPLRSSIMEKIEKIDNIESLLKSQSLFSILKEEVQSFAIEEDKALNSSIEALESQLKSLSASLNENFALPVEFLTQLSLPIDDYQSSIQKFYSELQPERKKGFEEETKVCCEIVDQREDRQAQNNPIFEKKLPISLPSTLKIHSTNGCLSIVTERDQGFSLINLDDRVFNDSSISKVKLSIRDWEYQAENIEVLKHIFTKLESMNTLSIHSAQQKIPDDCLIQLFEGISQKAKILENISLDFKMSKLEKNGLSYFCESVLMKTEKLNSLEFNLNSTKVDQDFLKPLSKSLSHLGKTLKALELQFSHLEAEEEQLAGLFVQMPHLTKLFLVLSHTKFGDEGLEAFAKVMLPSMKQLENLEIRLASTYVGNKSMEMVATALPKLKELQSLLFNLSSTKVKPGMKNKISQLEQEIALNL